MSEFNKWFKVQYGRLPNETKRQKAAIKARDAEWAAGQAKADYEREINLQNKYTYSLYGYNKGKGIK